jgi:hypothetical protein
MRRALTIFNPGRALPAKSSSCTLAGVRRSGWAAGCLRAGIRMPRDAERATHARFIEHGFSFGISTRPDQG